MRILILCSGNAPDFKVEKNQPFIYEQVESVKTVSDDFNFDYFFIKGKGVKGYLSSQKRLQEVIRKKKYHLIHAHFGLSGLLANLQRKVPVLTTYHGCDINKPTLRLLSVFPLLVSKHNIFVSVQIKNKVAGLSKNKSTVLPAGVDLDLFYPMEKEVAKSKAGLNKEKKYVLFSSSFDIPVKNYDLAKKAFRKLNKKDFDVIELKGYSREEVNLLMNASEFGLMTSVREGSPMFIKELMATGTPIVSTNVGDVGEVIEKTEGCFLAKSEAGDIAEKMSSAFIYAGEFKKTNGRKRIMELMLDTRSVANELTGLYQKVLERRF